MNTQDFSPSSRVRCRVDRGVYHTTDGNTTMAWEGASLVSISTCTIVAEVVNEMRTVDRLWLDFARYGAFHSCLIFLNRYIP